MAGIKDSIHKLLASEFYRSIISLFSGIFVARLIPAGFAIIIARIYDPSDFGSFILYLTIASVLSIITTGKYENALILVGSVKEKELIYRISQKINVSVNLFVLILIVGYLIVFQVREKATVFLMVLIPFYAFFFSSIQLIRNVFISNRQFKYLSILEITRSVIMGILQCLFFVFPGFGLFLGAVASQGIIYLYYTRRVPEAVFFKMSGFTADELELAKRFINFPKFSIVSEALNFTSSQLPVFLIKPFFGNTMLGLYSFSHRYISIPVQLLSTSISSVYLKKGQTLKDNPSELRDLTFSLFKKQIVVGVLPFTILGLWGSEIFRFVFGAEWEFSGYLAQLISPWLFAVMIASPLSSILIVREKQKFSMIFNLVLLAVRGSSLIIGGMVYKSISVAIMLYSGTGFLFFVVLGAYSLWLANVHLDKALIFTLKVLSITIIPLILIKQWF